MLLDSNGKFIAVALSSGRLRILDAQRSKLKVKRARGALGRLCSFRPGLRSLGTPGDLRTQPLTRAMATLFRSESMLMARASLFLLHRLGALRPSLLCCVCGTNGFAPDANCRVKPRPLVPAGCPTRAYSCTMLSTKWS